MLCSSAFRRGISLFPKKTPVWTCAGELSASTKPSPSCVSVLCLLPAYNDTTLQAIERLTEGLEDARQRAETAEALLEELQRGICPTVASSSSVSPRRSSPRRQSSSRKGRNRHHDDQGHHHALSPSYSPHRVRSHDDDV